MKKVNEFLKTNIFIVLYAAITVFIEFLAILVTSGKLRMTRPGIFLTILVAGVLILSACRKQFTRYIVSSGLILIHSVFCLVFITSFVLTSGTVFDFAQFHLVSDGMGTIESFKPNFAYFFPTAVVVSLYVILGARYYDSLPAPKSFNFLRTGIICMLCITFSLQGAFAYVKNNNSAANMTTILKSSAETNYTDQGIIGNFVNQLYKGIFFNNVSVGDTDELHDYIYEKVSEPTEKFGEASGMNTITILAESFEWFAFMADEKKYPNGIDADEETLREIFPNLYELYDTCYVFDNHHSREKTDISENYSILGCYPTGVYINYNFPNNSMPFSVPNVLKELYGVESNSFHNGQPNFYNRTEFLETAVGFEHFYATDKMVQLSGTSGKFTDYTPIGERNLDGEMIEVCKELMFPLGRERFNTNITTITQHGQYAERSNLKEYYQILDEHNICPVAEDPNDAKRDMKNYFRNYVATALELDNAIGKINAYLKENDLYDNTMLVIFGDHNAYYEGLSAYVKGLETIESDKNYCDLFRVPLMIRVGNKTEKLNKEERTVTKFTCSADIVPTMYDLLGIKYFSNMCFGVSAFDKSKTSVLYSRAYEVFITDKMYFYNLNNVIYKADDADEEYVSRITDDATELLVKISHINRIFYNDYFRGNNGREFTRHIVSINQ